MISFEINSLAAIHSAARKFNEVTDGHRSFAFYGPMGSGKTTFIKAICHELGATGLVTSPTFSLVNEYTTSSGETLYHFDLYRINQVGELYDLGYEEYFYGDNYIFIEWAEKAESLLPEGIVKVHLHETGENKRSVSIEL
ncbi:MAG TPA: tRNA (adenosine(37)-N6)-threonylcarbamoyltransferase complex ATPase subunit type 1 TsaE [Bacteroidales bacterium]|nr:tRNA (adenosine(37)-N6)-threonylcarbamoyltransferase complex ATPase subunit type 1 TsaE [Bacteroidales bacterium]